MDRYFIGLMAPTSVQQRLRVLTNTIQASLAEDSPHQATWHTPSDLHCTLLFIGQFPDEKRLESEMENVARQLQPMQLTITGATHWLGRNSLALAVTGADGAGTEFIEKLGHLSDDARATSRSFYGHITLGRVRPVPEAAADEFSGHTVDPITWNATTVQLVKRDPNAVSGRYRVVASRRFGA